MGDRVSIQFKDKYGELSPYLYSHWAGMALVKKAIEFTTTIRNEESAGDALAQFIQSPFGMKFDDLHLEFEDGGDNDDNGNHVIDIETKQSFLAVPKEPTKDEIKEVRRSAHSLIAITIQRLNIMKGELEKELRKFDEGC